MWIFLTLFATFIWCLCNFVDKHIAERYLSAMPRYYAVSAFGSGIFSLGVYLSVGWWLPPWPQTLLILLGGGGIAGMLWFYLKALKVEEASYVVPLFQLGPVWAALLAFISLGENLVGWDLIAFIVIFAGGVVVALEKLSKEVLQLRPAFGYMLVATLFVSAMFVSFKYVYNLNPDYFWHLYALQLLGQFLACGLLAAFTWKPSLNIGFKQTLKEILPLFLLNDFISFIAFAAYLWALALAPVALVGALGGVQGLFAFAIGAFLTLRHSHLVQENISFPVVVQKVFGGLIMLGGVALLQLS